MAAVRQRSSRAALIRPARPPRTEGVAAPYRPPLIAAGAGATAVPTAVSTGVISRTATKSPAGGRAKTRAVMTGVAKSLKATTGVARVMA